MKPQEKAKKIKELEEARQRAVIFGEWEEFRKVKKKWEDYDEDNTAE